jgi:hypothetical protein
MRWYIPVHFYRQPSQIYKKKKCLGAIFLSPPPLTWNPGSAPDINLNMYIINVIADDESKIGLYEI